MSGKFSPERWLLTGAVRVTVRWSQTDSLEKVSQKKESKNTVQPEDFLMGHNMFQAG